jgi:hypothetical protein
VRDDCVYNVGGSGIVFGRNEYTFLQQPINDHQDACETARWG